MEKNAEFLAVARPARIHLLFFALAFVFALFLGLVFFAAFPWASIFFCSLLVTPRNSKEEAERWSEETIFLTEFRLRYLLSLSPFWASFSEPA